MKTALQLRNRKYYLHRRVKAICRLKVAQRTMFVSVGAMSELSGKKEQYMSELRDVYGYAIQTEIE